MLNKTIRSILSLALVFCLLAGVSGNAIVLAVSNPASGTINKVDKEVNKIIADLEAKIADLEKEVEKQEKKLNDAKQKLDDGEARLPGDKEMLADKRAQLEDAKLKLADANDRLQKAKDTLAGYKAQLEELEKQLEALENQLAALPEGAPGRDAKLAEVNAKQAEVDTKQAEVDAKDKEVDEAIVYIRELTDFVDQCDKKIAEYEEKIPVIEQDIADAKEILPKAEKAVKEAKEAVADAKTVVESIKTTYADLYNAVTSPKVSLSFVKDTYTDLQNQMQDLWDDVLTLQTSLYDLEAAYEELEDFEIEPITIGKFEFDGFKVNKVTIDGQTFEGKEVKAFSIDGFTFNGFTAPTVDELANISDKLDAVIGKVNTLNSAMEVFAAAAKKVVAKVLDVAEEAIDIAYIVKANLNKEGAVKAYNWLYNNPDVVCGVVKRFGVFGLNMMAKYGPYAMDLLENHADLAELGMKLTLGGTFGVVTLGAGVLGYAGSKLDFLTDYKDDVMNVVRKLYAKYGDEAKALVKVYVEYLDLEDRYYNATHANYTIFHDSLYLAIGDSTAVGPDSYVDKLAELLEIPHMTQNLAEMDLTVEQAIELVKQNAELVGKADLITLGFSNIDASIDMLNALNQNLENGWTSTAGQLVGKGVDKTIAVLRERMAAYGVGEDKLDMLDMAGEMVDKALRALNNKLIEKGLDEDTINMVMASCEAYLASYVTRMAWYPVLVEAVYDINPDAQIIIVGTYNDLENVEIEVANRTFDIGQLTRGLIAIANLENLAQAFIGDECIYVHASAVETIFEENDYENLNNLGVVDSILNDEMLPSEAGHTYIAEQIREALNVEYKIWGDVNGDRKVNCRDARLILQYTAGLITEDDLDLTWADVNGDGVYNSRDARMILRLRVGQIEHFPVCQFSEE